MGVILPEKEREFIRQRLNRLGLHSLAEYHDSVFWMTKRNGYGKRHPRVCRCGARSNLKLHHRTYERLGNERDEDLMYLCGACHEREHRRWSKKVIDGRKQDIIRTLPEYRVCRFLGRQILKFNKKLIRHVIMSATAWNVAHMDEAEETR